MTVSLFAQEEEQTTTTYLDATTPCTVSTLGSVPWCTNAITFDLETINDDDFLDIAFGEIDGSADLYGIQNYNNESGCFPNQDGTFLSRYFTCSEFYKVNNVVFGKLRTSVAWHDLAFLCDDYTYIFLNSGNGITTPYQQALPGAAKDGCWGPFNSGDNYPDLAVTDWSTVKIYTSNNNGTVNSSPTTVSMAASKVILAQMNDNIYELPTNNKWDLVSSYDGVLSIRINDNNNGFNSPDTINIGSTIYGFAVGDLNEDGFNDVVVGLGNSLRVYQNTTSGGINHTPVWTQNVYADQILIGDMGGPGDATRDDGWNDLVVSDPQLQRRVLINQRNGTFTVEQIISGHPDYGTRKMLLADVQNTGGLSLVWGEFYHPFSGTESTDIKVIHHVDDPAPAPPKHVQVSATPPDEYGYRYPKITWASNKERDLGGYELWRMTTGAMCGTTQWTCIASSLSASQTEYTDFSISTATPNGDCVAKYKLRAKDVRDQLSDYSAIVEINYASYFWKGTTGQSGSIPKCFALHEAYPNPLNPSTQIRFELPEDSHVLLSVFDVLGRKVAELVNGNYAAGYYTATWNAAGVASGVYIARFTAADMDGSIKLAKTTKVMLAK